MVVFVIATVAPVFAHHGTSITYYVDKSLTLTGVVTEFVYGYPHPQLYFDVKDEMGNVQHWGSEFGPTPLAMRKAGWARDTIKAGDVITITCAPHKTPGATACLLRQLVLNGKEMRLNEGGRGNAPASN
jgi:hypothetical protein